MARARRPEQKEERRAAILEAAGRLLDKEGLAGTGLNAIARAAGISKPNVYRYFESREAILLNLFEEAQARWMEAFERRLKRIAGKSDVDGVARAFAATISKQPRFCVLVGVLSNVLERNVGEELVVEFKRRVLAQLGPVVSALEAAVPTLSPEQAQQFLVMQIMAASGTWPHCNPAPVVQEVLKRQEFKSLRFDFESMVRVHAAALLRGLLSRGK
jgi:TetR/AcrR family transcriptional regulator